MRRRDRSQREPYCENSLKRQREKGWHSHILAANGTCEAVWNSSKLPISYVSLSVYAAQCRSTRCRSTRASWESCRRNSWDWHAGLSTWVLMEGQVVEYPTSTSANSCPVFLYDMCYLLILFLGTRAAGIRRHVKNGRFICFLKVNHFVGMAKSHRKC